MNRFELRGVDPATLMSLLGTLSFTLRVLVEVLRMRERRRRKARSKTQQD